MNVAVIVARTSTGKMIAGEAGDSVAALTPKMLAIRDAGRIGKEPINRVVILSSWHNGPAEEREVKSNLKG